jgi:peroxiredoxin
MGPTLIVMIVLGLATAGLAAVLYQTVKQQGRLLMRLDQVERRLELDAREAVARGTVALQAQGPSGLAIGTALPDFELPDLAGRPVALQDFRGKRVLLVNWNAGCGFCDRIAPELAGLAGELERAGVELLLVSNSTPEAERELAEEHGLACPVLLQHGMELEAFVRQGTPVAYLLDEEGRVASSLAVGSDEVPALARQALQGRQGERRRGLPGRRPLSASRIERNGLKAGTPAPSFVLPDVQGGTASLAEHRGRKVLLVFNDPHCGPCDQIAPHLGRVHQEHRNNGLDVVLVGRGEPEENRRKAETHGFAFPVLVQRRWEISRQYGIFATPAAFLIDENGILETGAAKGADQILALTATLSARKEMDHA